MDMRDIKDKPETCSVKRKKLKTEAEALQKKEFLKMYSQAYNAFAAFANAYEKTMLKPKPRQRATFSRTITVGVEARKAKAAKHLDRAIISAESWSERDALVRRLASHCYQTAKWFMKAGDYKQAAKWITLTHRFLKLAMEHKVHREDEEFEAKLQEMQKKIEEIKEMNKQQGTGFVP
jgi:hypothetical protein